jgi:hypothetical protein
MSFLVEFIATGLYHGICASIHSSRAILEISQCTKRFREPIWESGNGGANRD